MMDDLFPSIKRGIENLIEDEEGNIPGNKLLMLGTMVIILGSLFPFDALAGHRSHSSHNSHSSHSSHSSGSHGSGGSHGSHESHVSHQSHQSGDTHSNHASHSSAVEHESHSNHSNHASHTSHSNTSSHSNSLYSSEGDVQYGPAASTIKGVMASPVVTTDDLFQLPNVNQNIESPNSTPGSGILPNLVVPASTPETEMDAENVKKSPPTSIVE